MLEDKLRFPEEAVRAAREFAVGKGLGSGYPEGIVTPIDCVILNEFQVGSIDYGVADAILSGKYIRLLHEIKNSKFRMNCAEVGVNGFLLYTAFNPENHVLMMRYNDGQPSDHFAILDYDMGDGQPPIIIDPLFHFSGRVVFTNDGFTYFPINLWKFQNGELTEQDYKELLDGKKEEQKHIVTRPLFLSVDEVMRHINYINSPLGFFDFFRRGQKLTSQKDGQVEIDFNARTLDECLVVYAVCDDMFPVLLTLERLFYIGRQGEMAIRDKRMLHTGYNWVRPKNIIYVETKGGMQVVHPKSNRKYTNSYMRYLQQISRKRRGLIFTPEEREGYLRKLEFELEGAKKKLLDHSSGGVIILRLDDENDEVNHNADNIKRTLNYIRSLQPESRDRLLDYLVLEGRIKSDKSRVSFRGKLSPKGFLQRDLELRYEMLKPMIDSFFESEVMKCLLGQYQEAVYLKRMVNSAI